MSNTECAGTSTRLSVSVVVPNYNHAQLVTRAVAALLHQQCPPCEIVIVDDASNDDSLSVIEGLRDRSGCIRLVRHLANRGAPAALNTGLHAARGDLVYFAAADDFALPNLLSLATTALMAHPRAAFFCAGAVLTTPSGAVLGYRPFMWPSSRATFLAPQDVRHLLASADNWAVGATVVFRRDRLVLVGGFDEPMGSLCDGMAVRRLALQDGFCFDPAVCAAWEIYPESLSARSSLSLSTSISLIGRAQEHVRINFPADFSATYAPVLASRLQFSMARLRLLLGESTVNAHDLATLAQLTRIDRTLLALFTEFPFAKRTAILGWLLLRLRPFGLVALLKGWLRARTLHPRTRRQIEAQVRQAQHPFRQKIPELR